MGPESPSGFAGRRLPAGASDRHAGPSEREGGPIVCTHYIGTAGGSNRGTVWLSMEHRTRPALIEANHGLAFATFHHARHGRQGTGAGSDGLQLRPGGDLCRSPGGESKPAPNQFLASPGCGQRVPAQSAGGSLGTRTCPSIGRHASPYCPMQTSPNQPSAELPQNQTS